MGSGFLFSGLFGAHGLLFFLRKLTVAVLVVLLHQSSLLGFEFFNALRDGGVFLQPIGLNGFPFFFRKLLVAVLIVLLQEVRLLGFKVLLAGFSQSLHFFAGQFAVLVGVILFKQQIVTQNESSG